MTEGGLDNIGADTYVDRDDDEVSIASTHDTSSRRLGPRLPATPPPSRLSTRPAPPIPERVGVASVTAPRVTAAVSSKPTLTSVAEEPPEIVATVTDTQSTTLRLKPGWHAVQDQHGDYYYYHEVTLETTWEAPLHDMQFPSLKETSSTLSQYSNSDAGEPSAREETSNEVIPYEILQTLLPGDSRYVGINYASKEVSTEYLPPG